MRTLLSKSFNRLTERNSVDLPQPEGPTNAVTLLRGIVIEMACSACFTPYHKLKFVDLQHRLFFGHRRVRFRGHGFALGHGNQAAGAGRSAGRLNRVRQAARFGDRRLLVRRFVSGKRIGARRGWIGT